MMRFVGVLSTAALIFMLGCGTGAYFVGNYAYIQGAKAAFTRCLNMSGSNVEAESYYPEIPSRRIRCGASVLLSHGLDQK